jgi:hypothetical protein
MKKVLIGLSILIAIILGAAIILPIVYKDKIVALVKDEVNKNINAKVDFGDFNLSLIRSFPNFSLSINDLSVVGLNDFQGDTLTSVKELNFTIDLMSVINGGQIDIRTIRLNQAYINLIVLKDGKANWDIAKGDTTSTTASSEPTKFKVALRKYALENSRLSYEDESMGFKMTMDNLNHSGNGDFTQDLFVLNTNTTADASNMWYGGVKYLHNVKTNLKADLEMDMPNMKFTFKENELALNELLIGMDGWVAMPKEDIDMDLKFDAKKNEFRYFLSMIPGVYSEGFKDLKSSGTLALKAFVKGRFNDTQMPGFGLNLKIQNGNFKYPALPIGVNNVQMDLNVNNPDGVPDHTLIDLSKLHAELGTEKFDAKLRVRTPVSDADLDGMLSGRINFANISKIVPLEAGTTLRGLMVSDLAVKGRMSAIEQKRYEDFDASGSISLTAFNYTSKDYKQGFDLNQCSLTFNPKNVTLNNLDARMGNSDIKANGSLDNLLAYVFKKETLKGTLNLISNNIDLGDFNSEESTTTTTAAADTTPLDLIEVPNNIDFVLNTSIGKIIYDNINLESVSGKLVIRDQTVNMDNLSFNTLGGSMKLSGLYATRERKKADINFNMNIAGFDIQQTVKTFNTVKKMAAIAEKASGNFSTQFNMAGKLDEHMQPNLNTLTGEGKLQTANVIINNFTPLVKVADVLKMDQFKSLPISNVNLSFKFEDGRVKVEPFDVTLAGITTTVDGSTGFDQTIDYTLAMNIPTSKLPSQASGAINGLISQANSKGANFSMSENVKMNLLMGGTVNNPTVKTDLKSTAGGVVNQLKDKAKDELEKQKKAAEEKARAEAEKFKNETEAKAKAEADRLKKEAEAKAKAEADRLKKEAEKKAKDALKGFFNKK